MPDYTLYNDMIRVIQTPKPPSSTAAPECAPAKISHVRTCLQASFGEMLYFAFNPTFLLLVIVFLYVTVRCVCVFYSIR